MVVAGVLGELEPREEVTASEFGAEVEAMETQSFAFDASREQDLLVEAPVEQVHEELASVEEAPTGMREEAFPEASSPPRDRAMSPLAELVYQNPPVTRS